MYTVEGFPESETIEFMWYNTKESGPLVSVRVSDSIAAVLKITQEGKEGERVSAGERGGEREKDRKREEEQYTHINTHTHAHMHVRSCLPFFFSSSFL